MEFEILQYEIEESAVKASDYIRSRKLDFSWKDDQNILESDAIWCCVEWCG